MVTTNRHVREWPDVSAGGEILNRLLRHVHIVHIAERSYRLRELDKLLPPSPTPTPSPSGGDAPKKSSNPGVKIGVLANCVEVGDP